MNYPCVNAIDMAMFNYFDDDRTIEEKKSCNIVRVTIILRTAIEISSDIAQNRLIRKWIISESVAMSRF